MNLKGIAILMAAASLPAFSSAALFTVDALANSTSGGVGKATVALTAGQAFTVTVDPNDLWSAGALPRWSNADGLTFNRYATGSDESGEAVGTLIGIDFGLHSQFGKSFAFGTLVGELNGDYFAVGTNYAGVASSTGTLNLYYWDSNNGDNTGSVAANVEAVPEPATLAALGLGAAAMLRRRRRA